MEINLWLWGLVWLLEIVITKLIVVVVVVVVVVAAEWHRLLLLLLCVLLIVLKGVWRLLLLRVELVRGWFWEGGLALQVAWGSKFTC